MTRPCPAFSPLPWDAGRCRCGSIVEAHPDPLPPDPRPSMDELYRDALAKTGGDPTLATTVACVSWLLPAGVGR